MDQEDTHQDYSSIEEFMPDHDEEIGKDELFTIQNADVVAMACCDKTDGACWTQM